MEKINRLNNEKGFTLIELIVSIALLSLLLLMFSSFFMYSVQLLGKASKQKVNSMSAASKIELDTATSNNANTTKTSGNISISFGGTPIVVSGNYIAGSDASKDVNYKSFIPDDIP